MALRRRATPAEEGFTLIELVISAALLAVVMLVVASITIAALKAQTAVRNLGNASNGAQLISRSIGTGIRNSSSFQAGAPDSNGQLLRARVVAGATGLSWTCRAWYYSATTGSVYTTSSPLGLVAAPAGVPAGWIVLATGVALPSGATQAFTPNGTQLKVALTVSARAAAHPVVLSTTFAQYPQSDLTTNPVQCF
jgi:prepilin-type N-terminal cleavage/methylation domain-containing protein